MAGGGVRGMEGSRIKERKQCGDCRGEGSGWRWKRAQEERVTEKNAIKISNKIKEKICLQVKVLMIWIF